jgi:Homeodomain-like domain
MPDWTLYDPQLRQWSAEGVKPDEIAKRLNLKRQTVRDRPIKLGLFVPEPKTRKSPHQEMTRPHETVEVLSGHLSTDEDTAGEVHDGAVHEFDRLPDGYAKEIQPMRPYSDAEEFALNESMRLFGFVGAIVRDQYGRILDGHHRQRVARLRGLGVPYTITQVRDDAHAVAVATSLNAVRRQYPREEREQIAIAMRDQGFSYRVIAAALGVSKDTVQRDIFGGFKIIPAPEPEVAGVSSETPARMLTESPVSSETAQSVMDNPPVSHETPARRIRGRDQKSYPAQRPTTQKAPKRSDSDDSTRAD